MQCRHIVLPLLLPDFCLLQFFSGHAIAPICGRAFTMHGSISVLPLSFHCCGLQPLCYAHVLSRALKGCSQECKS